MKEGKNMDKEKIKKKIDELKEKQVKNYVETVKKVVRENAEYYKDKEYADKFKD